MTIPHHWNYFLAVEADLAATARFVEFAQENLATYSTEFARLLMTATQEVDVLLHAVCLNHGDSSDKEGGYRNFIPSLYGRLPGYVVHVPRWELDCTPFQAWSAKHTPSWWTANNKVKHERAMRFADASLDNALHACAALLLVNVLYHHEQGTLGELVPSPQLLFAPDLVASATPTPMGMVANFQVP